METTQSFFEAVKAGEIELVRELVGRDPGLANARSENGVSAVLLAVYYGEPAIAEHLIEQGAQLDIFAAAATGKADQVRALLDENPTLANTAAADGFQPLGLASFFGHAPVVALLLERGAEVNSAARNTQRVMPLHSAVAARHLEIARILLEHGAEVNARQADDFTPLHEAVQNGQAEMVGLLLSYGADRDARMANGQTARSMAEAKGDREIVDLVHSD